MITKRYCFACDLKENSEFIEAYKTHHAPRNVWQATIQSIKDAGIEDLEIPTSLALGKRGRKMDDNGTNF